MKKTFFCQMMAKNKKIDYYCLANFFSFSPTFSSTVFNRLPSFIYHSAFSLDAMFCLMRRPKPNIFFSLSLSSSFFTAHRLLVYKFGVHYDGRIIMPVAVLPDCNRTWGGNENENERVRLLLVHPALKATTAVLWVNNQNYRLLIDDAEIAKLKSQIETANINAIGNGLTPNPKPTRHTWHLTKGRICENLPRQKEKRAKKKREKKSNSQPKNGSIATRKKGSTGVQEMTHRSD